MVRSKHLLGLDIGSSSIKVCLCKSSKKGVHLRNFDMAALPSEAIVDGAVIGAPAVIETIQELISRNKIRTKKAAISVSGSAVIIKKITLPMMTDEELEEEIQWEAEQYIPFDIKDVYLDAEVLGSRETQGQMMDVLLVAAKREMIDEYLAVVREVGLQPAVVDIDCFCLQNVFEQNYGIMPGETVVLLDVGASVININVLSDGVTSFTRDISMGGDQYAEEIQKQLNITFDEAEAYKLGGQKSEDIDTVVPLEVEKVIQQVSESIASEIQRSLDFYATTSADGTISKIYLSGGISNIPSLSSVMARVSGVPVEVLESFKNIRFDPKVFTPEFIESVSPVAAISMGLALRRSNEK